MSDFSAITIVEFSHGVERARTPEAKRKREAFFRDLRAAMKVFPLTDEIAELAGRISGIEAQRGVILPFADLLIGATAIHIGYDLVTLNVRHFEMIPELVVKTL